MSDARGEALKSKILLKAGSLALAGVSAIIVGRDRVESSVTSQMLRGFGLLHQTIFDSAEDAKRYLAIHPVDLCVIEYNLPDASGADLTKWIRAQSSDNRHVAILILIGLTRKDDVLAARDSGAHMILKKPTSADMLFDRIAWAARSRPFVDTTTYFGPDRRFKNSGPPDGVFRRGTDLKGQLADSAGPNLSQNDIDALLRPSKVTIE